MSLKTKTYLIGMIIKCFLIFLQMFFQSDYEIDNLVAQATDFTIFPECSLLILQNFLFWILESRSAMNSAEDNLKKAAPYYSNESADSDDNDSECVDSEKINFTATEEDKESESTSDSGEEDAADHDKEAAVVRMLKEKEEREKEVEDPDHAETYCISTTDEVIWHESENESRDFTVPQNKLDFQNPGKELLPF